MKLLLMSDIHGNICALDAVIDNIKNQNIDACILLGDLIDYGMHSNEVIENLKKLPYPVICNIYGNHERAIMQEDYLRFSSDRGRQCAQYTRTILNEASFEYIKSMKSEAKYEFTVEDKKFLAVHGSLKDNYWKSINPGDDLSEYEKYDFVLSGHSHLPHFFEKYFNCDNTKKRNKKKTIFINPGSVGQPRNLNAMAQFALLDSNTEEIELKKANYDIKTEQSAYSGQVDNFYKLRLEEGV